MSYSRFYRCDLHVHTAADKQQAYGDFGDAPSREFAEQLLNAHQEAGVEVVAITDHNRADWYPVMREVGDELGIHVFPGLEFSANGCHLLAIWDPTEDAVPLAERLLAVLFPGKDFFDPKSGDPKPVTAHSIEDAIRKAHEHRALVLAPHATQKEIGLFGRKVVRHSSDIAQSGDIAGFDVVGNKRADVLSNPTAEFGPQAPSWFLSGDVRDFESVGRRTTFLKLGNPPTLEGLRQAFLAPDTRIRFPERLEGDWNHVAGVRFLADPTPRWPRIASVEIAGGFHDGLSIKFAPGLNAVIGGKGTGKSALIEILRYVLEASEPAEDELRANREHNFRANAEAMLEAITEGGEHYQVHRSGDETPARLLRNGEDTGIAVGRRVGARIFGQRELHELIQREDLKREFVAAHAGQEWRESNDAEDELSRKIAKLDKQLDGMELELGELEEQAAELADLSEKLARAKKLGVEDLLKESEALSRADITINDALHWPEKVEESLEGLTGQLPPPALPNDVDVPEGLAEMLQAMGNAIASATNDIRNAIEESAPDRRSYAGTWARTHDKARKQIDVALSDAGIADLKSLTNAQRRIARLEKDVGALPKARDDYKKLANQRRELLTEVSETRRKKSRLVEDAARELTERVGKRVRVRIEPLADRSTLNTLLKKAVQGQNVRSDQIDLLARAAPQKVADALQAGPSAIEKLGVSSSTAAKLSSLPPSTIRSIEETATPDRVQIEIDLGTPGRENWTPVDKASPGQRATAMLALALASGTEPLIIDQPEDDLDNRYIYDEVVKVLARTAESRQIIVVTHNANIPVLGDAELVLALDAKADRAQPLSCGGLEESDVIWYVRHILEGGDAAFDARSRRYLASVQSPRD